MASFSSSELRRKRSFLRKERYLVMIAYSAIMANSDFSLYFLSW